MVSNFTVQEYGSTSAATSAEVKVRMWNSRAGNRNQKCKNHHERLSKSKRLSIRNSREDRAKQNAAARIETFNMRIAKSIILFEDLTL